MTRYILLALSILAGPVAGAWAQEPTSPAKGIAPLVDEHTIAVGHVDLSKVNVSAVVKNFVKMTGIPAKETQVVEKFLTANVNMLRQNGVNEVYAVITLKSITREPFFLAFPVPGNSDAGKLVNIVRKITRAPSVKNASGFIVAGPKHVVAQVESLQPQPRPQLAKAFASAKSSAIRGVVLAPEGVLYKALQEVAPKLPDELGGENTSPFLKSFRFAVAGIKLLPSFSAEATIQVKDAKSAKRLAALYGKGLMFLKKEMASGKLDPDFNKTIKVLTPIQNDNRLTLKLKQEDLVAVLRPLVKQARTAAKMAQNSNNLKQIGLALHSYHDVYKQFPAVANYDKNGKPLLSWRVHILPFVEQQKLYKQFKLNEPWNSPHNKKLIAQMPPVFRSPGSKAKPGTTTYLAPFGNSTVLGKTPTGITEIRDGTSVTIMILDADDNKSVVWSKPGDMPIDLQKPLQGLGNNANQRFSALFADGSVRVFTRAVAPATFRAYLTKNGGEVINP